jgi:hypothetical protein
LNVAEADLREAVLGPWVAGLPLEFGEQRWEPGESRLTILAGPALPASPATADDAGWEAALRSAEDVTRPMLEAAEAEAPVQAAAVVEADSVEEALQELGAGQLPKQVPWSSALERLETRDPNIAAVLLIVKRSRTAWIRR